MTSPYGEFIDITGTFANDAPLVAGGVRAYYATGSGGIAETAAQVAAAKAAGMGVILIDQTPGQTVFGSGVAQVGDIEAFAGTIAAAAAMVAERQAHGLISVLYVSQGSWAALKAAIANPSQVYYWIANWSDSLASAEAFIAANADVVAVQFGDPASNPNTLVPGTSKTISQVQADIDVGRTTWLDMFLPGPAPAPPPAPHPVSEPLLFLGCIGGAVKLLQTLLNARPIHPGLLVDGIFGFKTLAAVDAIQRNNGLLVDGFVGPKTWGILGNYS